MIASLLSGIPDAGAAAAFAEAGPDDMGAREALWRDFERLLGGGKRDKGGALIRLELGKIPPAQWPFVVRVDRERRAIFGRLGNGPLGNISQSLVGACRAFRQGVGLSPGGDIEPRKCDDRSLLLTARAKPLLDEEPYRRFWSASEITANYITVADSRGLGDELYGGVHWANCFIFNGGGAKVELVADAWDDSLIPAYEWWLAFDKDTHEMLYRRSQQRVHDWCGEKALSSAVEEQKRRRQKEREALERFRGQMRRIETL